MGKQKKFHYAFIILIAASLVRGFSGPAINASSGLFLTPVSSELGIGIGSLSLYLSISSIVTLFFLPLGGALMNKYSAKWIAAIGVLFQALAFGALGFMRSVWGWYIMAVPLSIGAAILVNLLGPVLINRWFGARQGLMMGIMMTITSVLGALFQPLLTGWIENRGWRFAYVAFGALALVSMLLLILLFIRSSPADRGLAPFGLREGGQAKRNVTGVSAAAAIKSPAFYMLLLYMVVLTGFASFSQHMTTFGLDLGFRMSAIGTALSLSMIGSAIGSIFIGVVSDRWGGVTTGLGVIAVALLTIGAFWLGQGNYAVFVAAAFLHGLAASAIGVLAPILTTTFFGGRDYERIFSLVMTGAPLASIVLMPAYGFVYDAVGGYWPVFLFLLAALLLGAGFLLIGRKNSERLQQGTAK